MDGNGHSSAVGMLQENVASFLPKALESDFRENFDQFLGGNRL
jgi:hypothetical protein